MDAVALNVGLRQIAGRINDDTGSHGLFLWFRIHFLIANSPDNAGSSATNSRLDRPSDPIRQQCIVETRKNYSNLCVFSLKSIKSFKTFL